MKLNANPFKRLRAFKEDESGVLTVEAILILPMLLWTMMATFTFFEGFRQSSSNLKAAYTVSDLVSRETQTITDTYVDSLQLLMQTMVNNGTPISLRLTLIAFDAQDDRHYVRWSTARGFANEWDNGNIDQLRSKLPPMPNQDTLIIVETSNRYDPIFAAGIPYSVTFENFVFTRPRFTNEIDGAV